MCKSKKDKRNITLFFIIILSISFFLRFWGITFPIENAIPPGLWFDEALNGLDAYCLHSNYDFRLIYPDVFPREGMFIWILGLMTSIFGDNIFSLRFSSCLISTLAVGAFFFLIREIFSLKIAFLAMIVLGIMRWSVHFGHLVFRTNLVPLFSSLSLLFLIRIRKNPEKKINYFLFGLILAGGFYTYLSWYFVLPVLFIVAIINFKGIGFWGSNESQTTSEQKFCSISDSIFKLPKSKLLILLTTFIIFFTPIFLQYLFHPSSIFARPAEVSPLKQGLSSAIEEIFKNTKYVISMFSFSGDHVAKHNIPYRPVFGSYGFIFFWLGIFILIKNIKNNSGCIIILCWIIFSSLPSIFSKTDSANMLRNLGATPPSAIIYSIGIFSFAELVRKIGFLRTERLKKIAYSIFIFAGFLPLILDLYAFFFIWKNDPRVASEFLIHIVKVAKKCNELSSEYPVAVTSEIADNLTFKYVTLKNNNVYSLNSEKPDLDFIFREAEIKNKNSVIVVMRKFSDTERIFLQKYPEAKITGYFKTPEEIVWAEMFVILHKNQ